MALMTQVKLFRSKMGMTQEEVAEKVGVSRQAVAKWEKGETQPDIESCVKLADLFGVSVDALVRNMQNNDKGQQICGCVKVNDKGQITLPAPIREAFGLKTGNMILVLADTERGIVLVNMGDGQAEICMPIAGKKGEA